MSWRLCTGAAFNFVSKAVCHSCVHTGHNAGFGLLCYSADSRRQDSVQEVILVRPTTVYPADVKVLLLNHKASRSRIDLGISGQRVAARD